MFDAEKADRSSYRYDCSRNAALHKQVGGRACVRQISEPGPYFVHWQIHRTVDVSGRSSGCSQKCNQERARVEGVSTTCEKGTLRTLGRSKTWNEIDIVVDPIANRERVVSELLCLGGN